MFQRWGKTKPREAKELARGPVRERGKQEVIQASLHGTATHAEEDTCDATAETRHRAQTHLTPSGNLSPREHLPPPCLWHLTSPSEPLILLASQPFILTPHKKTTARTLSPQP